MFRKCFRSVDLFWAPLVGQMWRLMKSTCQYMISQHLMRQTSPFLFHCSQTFQVAAGAIYMFVDGLKNKSSYCCNNHCVSVIYLILKPTTCMYLYFLVWGLYMQIVHFLFIFGERFQLMKCVIPMHNILDLLVPFPKKSLKSLFPFFPLLIRNSL